MHNATLVDRAARIFAPVIEQQRTAEQLCVECRENPRAGSGALSRCLHCIKAAAQIDREQREARQAKAREKVSTTRKTSAARKACRTCKAEKPLSSFGKHHRAKDGRRRDCSACAGHAKRKPSSRRSSRAAGHASGPRPAPPAR